jgi:hypothetical protein
LAQRCTIVLGEEKNSINTPTNGMLFLAVTTNGGGLVQLPFRGRNKISHNSSTSTIALVPNMSPPGTEVNINARFSIAPFQSDVRLSREIRVKRIATCVQQ